MKTDRSFAALLCIQPTCLAQEWRDIPPPPPCLWLCDHVCWHFLDLHHQRPLLRCLHPPPDTIQNLLSRTRLKQTLERFGLENRKHIIKSTTKIYTILELFALIFHPLILIFNKEWDDRLWDGSFMVLVLLIRLKYQSSPPAAVVAEWLRRWTRNPMGSPRTGSNPVGCDKFLQFWKSLCQYFLDRYLFYCLGIIHIKTC